MTAHTEKDFEQLLNEIDGDAVIAGFKYPAGYALRLVDPILFREMYLEWIDSDECLDGYEDVDFDTLPEEARGCDIVTFEDAKYLPLFGGKGWDDMNIVYKDGGKVFLVHAVDSSQLDEFEYYSETPDILWGEEGGKRYSIRGAFDFYKYQYHQFDHSWEEVDSGWYGYDYNGERDTIETIFDRVVF